jgi:hypothetical protein
MEKLNKAIRRLRQKSGMSYPFVVCLLLVMLMIMFGVLEAIRVNVIASNVRDKFQQVIISETTDNYIMMYQPLRDGYAAPYQFSVTGWQQSSLTSRQRILSKLNADFDDGEHSQITVESVDFSTLISSIAPADPQTAVQYTVRGEAVVVIPYKFLWAELPPIRLTVNVNSTWRQMF